MTTANRFVEITVKSINCCLSSFHGNTTSSSKSSQDRQVTNVVVVVVWHTRLKRVVEPASLKHVGDSMVPHHTFPSRPTNHPRANPQAQISKFLRLIDRPWQYDQLEMCETRSLVKPGYPFAFGLSERSRRGKSGVRHLVEGGCNRHFFTCRFKVQEQMWNCSWATHWSSNEKVWHETT